MEFGTTGLYVQVSTGKGRDESRGGDPVTVNLHKRLAE